MELKMQIVRDGKVIIEMPLSPSDLTRKPLQTEMNAFEEEFGRASKVFEALSNETRLRMMRRLLEEEDGTLGFADFMKDLDLNPKLVWENARKLREGGLLQKTGRGRYSCSEFGQRTFMLMGLALGRLKEALEELEELEEL
jgi:DNA-binding transcriptional ArsR family regulator